MNASRCTLLMIWFLVLSWGLPARAQESGSTVALLEKATDLYSDLKFEAALKVLYRAFGNKGNTREQLVRAYMLTGICLGSLERYDQAHQAFARMLALDPSVRLDANLAPRVREPFRRLFREGRPRLDVRVLPPPRAIRGDPLKFIALVKDDALHMSRAVRIWVRPDQATRYSSVRARLQGEGEIQVPVAVALWEGAGPAASVAWYAVVEGENESVLVRFGDELHPLAIEVADQAGPGGAVAGSGETSWYERWWVWALVGVAVAGATTAAVLLVPQDSSGRHDVIIRVE
jgi:hypothetical protein